jgi:hypothetical protein
VLLGALWAAAAVIATAVGLLAVRLVAGDLGGSVASPLTGEEVQQALSSGTASSTPSTRPTPHGSRTPSPTAGPSRTAAPRGVVVGAVRTVRTTGGTVSARCEAGSPELLYATPADGWRTKDSSDTRVRFERGDTRITVRLACSGAVLRTSVTTDDETSSPSPSPRRTEDHDSPSPSPSKSEDHGGDDG